MLQSLHELSIAGLKIATTVRDRSSIASAEWVDLSCDSACGVKPARSGLGH